MINTVSYVELLDLKDGTVGADVRVGGHWTCHFHHFYRKYCMCGLTLVNYLIDLTKWRDLPRPSN